MAYYANEKEKQVMMEKMGQFSFEELDKINDNHFVLLSGE